MFKLVLNKKKDYHAGELGQITSTVDGRTLCRVESWAFTSCGIGALTQLNNVNFKTAEEVQQFFDFVCKHVADDWSPNEFYFLVRPRVSCVFTDVSGVAGRTRKTRGASPRREDSRARFFPNDARSRDVSRVAARRSAFVTIGAAR